KQSPRRAEQAFRGDDVLEARARVRRYRRGRDREGGRLRHSRPVWRPGSPEARARDPHALPRRIRGDGSPGARRLRGEVQLAGHGTDLARRVSKTAPEFDALLLSRSVDVVTAVTPRNLYRRPGTTTRRGEPYPRLTGPRRSHDGRRV